MVEVHTQSVGINTEPLLCRVRILSCAHKLIMSAGVILMRARVIYLLQELFTLCCTSNLYFADKIWKKKRLHTFLVLVIFIFINPTPDPTWSFKSKSRVTALILNHNTITFVIMFCTLFSVFFSLTEFHSWGNFSNIWLKERRLVGENLLWCL